MLYRLVRLAHSFVWTGGEERKIFHGVFDVERDIFAAVLQPDGGQNLDIIVQYQAYNGKRPLYPKNVVAP